MAMGDALALACSETRGFTSEDFARFHPGGRLGRKLRQVATVMHTGTELPRVETSTSMRETLEQITRMQLGMTCVVEPDGRLAGVLTDGDLRRRMTTVPAPLEGTASEAMTRSPGTIDPGALASEALMMMEQRKITSLPVVDENSNLVGVVHLHDLWRTELF
jgi:arabinose-5-phosphate isomerase